VSGKSTTLINRGVRAALTGRTEFSGSADNEECPGPASLVSLRSGLEGTVISSVMPEKVTPE
jgi:hypothetical protein